MTARTSAQIDNIAASPRVKNNSEQYGPGRRRTQTVYIAAGDTDSATTTWRLCRVRSSDRITSIKLTAPDATTAGAIDIGYFWVAEDPKAAGTPAVVAVTAGVETIGGTAKGDVLVDGFALTAGPFSGAEIMYAGGTNARTKANSARRVWEDLGLTVDPQKDFEIAVTVATTFNGGPASDGVLFEIETAATN